MTGQTATKNDAVIKLIKEEFKHIEVVRGGSVGIEGEPDIGLLPGVFRVISMMIEGHDSNLGEIEILEPGMEYTLTIDYAQKKAILSDYDEHK